MTDDQLVRAITGYDPPPKPAHKPTICVECRHCRGELRKMCHATTFETRETFDYVTGERSTEVRAGIYWHKQEDGGIPCIFINKGDCPHFEAKGPQP